MYLDKTLQRLHDFEKTTNINLHKAIFFNGVCYPSIIELAYVTSKYIEPTKNDDVIVCHGDFCFSNILYDFRMQRVKLIDPRGINSKNELSIWGDLRYDLAKLNHSVSGLYDLIIAGQFSIMKITLLILSYMMKITSVLLMRTIKYFLIPKLSVILH